MCVFTIDLLCIAALFIDVGTNYSVLDHTNLSFIYEDVLSPGPNADGEFVSNSASWAGLAVKTSGFLATNVLAAK